MLQHSPLLNCSTKGQISLIQNCFEGLLSLAKRSQVLRGAAEQRRRCSWAGQYRVMSVWITVGYGQVTVWGAQPCDVLMLRAGSLLGSPLMSQIAVEQSAAGEGIT